MHLALLGACSEGGAARPTGEAAASPAAAGVPGVMWMTGGAPVVA